MELKRKFDLRTFLAVVYVAIAAVYLFVGFMPADAEGYEISGKLLIPRIGLNSDVTDLELEGKVLPTPDLIVGSYSRAKNKTLLIGHSATAFTELDRVWVGDEIIYKGRKFIIVDGEVLAKEEINMNEVLASEEVETLTIMTCAGELIGEGDATHRLILTAEIAEN